MKVVRVYASAVVLGTLMMNARGLRSRRSLSAATTFSREALFPYLLVLRMHACKICHMSI